MTANSHARGSAQIAREINAETLKQEGQIERSINRMMRDANRRIDDLKRRNEELEALLFVAQTEAAAQKERADHVVTTMERTQYMLEYYQSLFESTKESMEKINRSHTKLSEIVRFAMSPEKYHFWREEVDELYPELSGKADNNTPECGKVIS